MLFLRGSRVGMRTGGRSCPILNNVFQSIVSISCADRLIPCSRMIAEDLEVADIFFYVRGLFFEISAEKHRSND